MPGYRALGDYVIPGPDGRRYYDIIGVSPFLLEMYENLSRAYAIALRRPGGTGRAQATEIALLLRGVQTRMDEVAAKTATITAKAVLDRIAATRKRPVNPTTASAGGRLSGGVRVRPLPVVLPRGSGGVGIGEVEALEAATRSGHPTKSRYPFYWRTQEDGSRAMVGRTLFGVFQPGESMPGAAASGTHPIFEARRSGKRGKMTIRRPVQARNFLKDGANLGRLYHYRQVKGIEKWAIERMNVISAASPRAISGLRKR